MVHYHLWSEPVLVEILVKSAGKAEVPGELAVLCLLTQCGYKAVHLTVRPNINFSKYFYKVLTFAISRNNICVHYSTVRV